MSTIKQVRDVEKRMKELENQIKNLHMERHLILEDLKNEKGVTFKQGKKWYQIRARKGENYIATSIVPFSSWLKKTVNGNS